MDASKTIVVALIAAVVGLQRSTPALAAYLWERYVDPEVGYTFEYPPDVLEPVSSAGQGQRWGSPDLSVSLAAGATRNREGRSIQSYLRSRVASYKGFSVSYGITGDNWFVISGDNGERVFYEKVIFTCRGRTITGFSVLYNIEEKAVLDPIVERIEETFSPGSVC